VRPRRLEVEGFTAFRERQPVDFIPLSLFAITGPTGSGKTSLLDAMGFALYGQVARIGRHGLGELVSHGKAEARILLEFSVDGSTYRLSRRLPRSGAQQGKLERLEGDTWVDAVERSGVKALNATVEELVKLDFESFCKAVVLPQGEFAKFLKGEPADRRRTLVALLGLGHYDRMAGLARQRASELKIRGEQTRRILADQFADATEEALDEANTALGATAAGAAAARKALVAAHELDSRRSAAATRVLRATDLAAQCEALAKELRAERSACVQAEIDRRDAAVERKAALAAVATAGEELAATTAAVEKLTERAGSREELSRLRDASERLVELERRVTESEGALGELATRETEATSELTAAQEQVERTAAAVTGAATAETGARTQRDAAKAAHEEALRVLAAVRTAEERAEQAGVALAESQPTAEEAARAAERASAGVEAAEQAHEQLRREHTVAVLVADLGPGDPCPVCERQLQERPAVDADAGARLAEAERALATCRTGAKAAASAAAEARADVTGLERRVSECEVGLNEALGGARNADAVAAALASTTERVAVVETALGEAESAHSAADEALAATREEVARVSRRVDAMAVERQALEDAAKLAVADRDAARELLRGRFGDEIPPDANARLAAEYEKAVQAEAAVTGVREQETAARDRLAAADERLGKATEATAEIDLRLQQLRGRAETAAGVASELTDEPVAPALPEAAPGRDARAEDLAAWCDEAARRLGDVGDAATRDAAGAEADLAILAEGVGIEAVAEAVLAAVEQHERDAGAAQVRSEEAVKMLERRVSQREGLEGGIAADEQRVVVLEVLATELRADHFVDFVIQETLDVLAVRASEELLRITDRRYSLLSRDGHFEVVDHVNADETRSVKTLSGGETFMASLSLALALSKHVTELAGEGLGARLEAVFIDEGFGSLDSETLEEVIDALERLREDDLLVGVISHVAALAERINEGLEVRKEGTHSVVVQSP
jgi:exonuclease SbcC